VTSSTSSTEQPSVLIIDDDDITRTMAIGFLSQYGFVVSEAGDGQTGLTLATQLAPDLVILDVEMPDMDGFEVCVELRKIPAFKHTPILMLTGLENDEYIDKAYVAGATDFASKPINWSLLSHRLRYMQRASIAAAQLLREQSSLGAAQRIAQIGSWQYDFQSETTEWSDQLFKLFGLEPNEVAPSVKTMLSFVHPDDIEQVERWREGVNQRHETSSIDHQLLLGDGSIRKVRQHIEVELGADGEISRLNATVQDFTERRLVEEKVHQLAYYDTLTNLPNRSLLQERLELAMSQAESNNSLLAVLYFDLDDFKRVNDTFGHAIGDKLLCEVGARLTQSLRISTEDTPTASEDNTIARMGGDEFIIVLNNIKESADAEAIAERIVSVVSEPYRFDEYELFTSPSIGLALFPKDGESADTLLKNADMAMYEAKRTGKNMYMVHNEDMQAKALKRYDIDARMRNALDNDEFEVHYQPQIDIENGKIYSAEALARWNSKTLGFVSPADFIPVAEDNGLIVSIGEWVLRQSCLQAKQWIDGGFPVSQVAVNISVIQFMRTSFPDVVCRILDECELPAQRLELEITESLLASDTHQAVGILQKLHEIGVQLSIDDFGTGYSSLSQLKHFPIDRLKIDQSFVRNITQNQNDAAITRAVVAMSKSMNIKVLAEGVETLEQLEFLREAGCNEVQGYLFSKPVPADQLHENMPKLLNSLGELFDSSSNSAMKKAG